MNCICRIEIILKPESQIETELAVEEIQSVFSAVGLTINRESKSLLAFETYNEELNPYSTYCHAVLEVWDNKSLMSHIESIFEYEDEDGYIKHNVIEDLIKTEASYAAKNLAELTLFEKSDKF